jgi:hypothetical protein
MTLGPGFVLTCSPDMIIVCDKHRHLAGLTVERWLAIIWRDERGGEICRSGPLRLGGTIGYPRLAIPPGARHCDVVILSGQDNDQGED